MRIRSVSTFVIWLLSIVALAVAKKPIRSIEISLRGKVYKVRNVTTVAELQHRLFELSGQHETLHGRVEYKGKKLLGSDVLRDVGVKNGAKLTLLPGGMNNSNHNIGSNNKGSAANRGNRNKKTFKEMLQGDFDMTSFVQVLQIMDRNDLGVLIRQGLRKCHSALQQSLADPQVRSAFTMIFQNQTIVEELRKNMEAHEDFAQLEEMAPVFADAIKNPKLFNEYVDRLRSVAERTLNVALDALQDMADDLDRGSAIRLAEQARRTADYDSRSGFFGTRGSTNRYDVDDESFATNVLFELSDSDED